MLLLLQDADLDALPLGERDEGLRALANNENVGVTRSEGLTGGVLDVDDVVRTSVTLTVFHKTNTTDVATSSDHAEIAGVELDVLHNFALLRGGG